MFLEVFARAPDFQRQLKWHVHYLSKAPQAKGFAAL